MPEFKDQDLRDARFERVDLTGATFELADLSQVQIHNVDLTGAKISGAYLARVDISGEIDGLLVNGVDVGPLVEAELNRRHPERAVVLASVTGDADAMRAALAVVERAWPSTIERIRRLPQERQHERVDGQWSVIENLRHLVFAIDAWVKRTLLGDPLPYHPLGLPHDEMGEVANVPNDPDARPALDEVLAAHADRLAVVRSVIEELTDDQLGSTTEPNPVEGYPETDAYPVRRCLCAVVIEEWEHRMFIERDLDVLAAPSGQHRGDR